MYTALFERIVCYLWSCWPQPMWECNLFSVHVALMICSNACGQPASRNGSRQLLVMLGLEGLHPAAQGSSSTLQIGDRHQV